MLEKHNRVCAYDRAGSDASDPGPLPRDGAAIAADLDETLRRARVRGPFVLVGHSAGALYVRLFAARRPRQVVGAVLVDPSVEYQPQKLAQRLGGQAGGIEGIRRRAVRCAAAALAAQRGEQTPALEVCAPASARPEDRAIALKPSYWAAQASEIETLFAGASDEVAKAPSGLKGRPVIILTAASSEGPPASPAEGAWRDLHAQLAAQLGSAQQRLVKSSHLMMRDRPDVIAQAVEEVLAAADRPKHAVTGPN